MPIFLRSCVLGALTWLAGAALPATAAACGGFFCNRAQPVNQAAEGIIFADNGDGTTTAVIQILYQGPSQKFTWLLPISSVPRSDSDIGVASNLALQRLQLATNPNYSLTTRVEGTCRAASDGDSGCGASSTESATLSAGRGFTDDSSNRGVVVEATGVVGAFEWTVISLDASLPDPADAALEWLTVNGYDVPSSAPALLGPYLKAGLYLLALRLTKDSDVGSIRPIVLTYQGTQPSIPVKLTSVAANDDMGVLTWILGKSRAVPENYLSLELNEARINWFNAGLNYNTVVSEAANDAGGQGFVTELAGPTSTLSGMIWTAQDEASWQDLKARSFSAGTDFLAQAYALYGSWDGFWDATRAAIPFPAGETFAEFRRCPACTTLAFEISDYLAQLDGSVIQPVKRVQALIDAHPQITRLYTTLSADEMTIDPLFTFNADLPNLSNQHTAERVIVCNPGVDETEAPWHIDLPQASTVWGSANDANSGTWPAELNPLPPNRVITRAGSSGTGKVIEDNSATINARLDTYNNGKTAKASGGGGCTTGRSGRSSSALIALCLATLAIARRRRGDRPLKLGRSVSK